ncbi:portal protein [Stenotrophomonas phage Sonora]|nr:portal protein [Stenotrophomonas phage Sonora]
MSKKDPTSPATTSDAYDCMAPKWRLIDTLLSGTVAMREAGQEWTPRHEQESTVNYDFRLGQTVLLNMTEETLDQLSGKPFSEPMKLGDNVPSAIKGEEDDSNSGLTYDIDLQGNNLDVFCQQWFREGLGKAFAHVLVDMPRPSPRPDNQPRTLNDDRREGLRPYWNLIKPECLIFARAEMVNGTETLVHARILEHYTVQDGFAEVEKCRIRVLERGHVQLWEPHPTKKKDGKPVWIMVDEWDTALQVIPLVTFYANRTGFMTGKPPLEDLAWLNVAHWNSSSDQRNILRVARFPMLACSGASAEDSDPVVIGPHQVLYNSDPQGKFYYVEHTGAAIEQGSKDLEALEEQMAMYGQQFLREKPGNETATGRALDTAENNSDLSAWAAKFEDAVAQALDFTAEWMSLSEEGGSVEVVKNFNKAAEDAEGFKAIQNARDKRDLSRFTLLTSMVQRGYLPKDFNIDEDQERLLEEQDTALARAGFDLDPMGNPRKPALDEDGNPINTEDQNTPNPEDEEVE